VIWGCAWAPCGRMAATGARDCAVRLWRGAAARGETGAPSGTRAWWHTVECLLTAHMLVPELDGICLAVSGSVAFHALSRCDLSCQAPGC